MLTPRSAVRGEEEAPLPYVLGIDVAPGRTHAATSLRRGVGWEDPEPLWLGERGVPAVSGLASSPIAEASRWRVVERRPLGQDTLIVVDRT